VAGRHGKNAVSHFPRAAATFSGEQAKRAIARKWKPMQARRCPRWRHAPTSWNGFFDGHVVDGASASPSLRKWRRVLADVIGECDFCRIPSMVESERCACVLGVARDVRGGHAVLPDFSADFPAGTARPLSSSRRCSRARRMEQCAEVMSR